VRLEGQRDAVVTACRSLAVAGLVRGTSGNVSVLDRVAGLVAASPSGTDYDTMATEDVAVVSLDGDVLEGRLEPTSELGLHLAVYRARVDVGAVVHTHSTFATTFAVLRREVPAVHYVLARAGSSVRVAPYERYGSAELAEACVATLGQDYGVLLANHGAVAVGGDLAGAMAVAEAVETCAELAWRAELSGRPHVLDAAEIAAVGKQFGGYGRARRRS